MISTGLQTAGRAGKFIAVVLMALGLTTGFILGQANRGVDLWRADKALNRFAQAIEDWNKEAYAEIQQHNEQGKSLYSPDLHGAVRESWLRHEVSEKFRRLERELGL